MRKLLLFISCFILFLPAVFSQAPASWTSAEMYQAIRKLNVLGTVLYVAAHPDDENTRLIAYLSKDKLYRTGYLSLTRGDGGQNLIGNEQGIELGLIRTQELLSARRIDGGEQFFSRAYDFGFSKNPEETFTKWDREKILSDVVWVIRNFQPDVIITRFPTTGEGGHGHHTASAILASDAFTAAADPNRFPEQLKYVQTWQPRRILWNTFNFGGTNTQSNDQFKFDVGGYNPLLGKSYGEIAATSRSQHKSQGFGVPAGRGEALEFFKTMAGPAPENDLMDGVDQTWKRVVGGEKIESMVNGIAASFDFLHPEKSVKELVVLYQALQAMPQGYWRDKKLSETQQIIEQCSGLFIDATSPEQFAVQTDSVRINFSLNNRLGTNATLKQIKVDGFDSLFSLQLARNRNMNFGKMFFVPASRTISQPYWLIEKMEPGYYTVNDQHKIGQPDADGGFTAGVTINIEGQDFIFSRTVKFKFTDPVRGELYQPLVIVPAIFIRPDEGMKISTTENKFEGTLSVTSKKKNASVKLGAKLAKEPPGFKIDLDPPKLEFSERNKVYDVDYKIKADTDYEYPFSATDEVSGTVNLSTLNEVKYDHIPYISYYTPAIVVNRKIDLKIYNKKIGYIIGAGDKVPDALEQMGYDVTLLTDKELSRNNLNQYDAIITGVRAYNTNEWMNKHYDKLMKYVHEGGNLIVQYNTSNNIGPVRARIGPYNFNISRTRVTDENAEVVFLKPDHAVLNFPNKITQQDFKGWVQERSIYHAAARDSTQFESVLSMHDPGEPSDDGSLIIAKHGKGYFTYTGIVFFRELPAGVPGAYRLLANIIALNKKKAF
jgi:LmbE family N-acetylglucosaminyl deacetylase